MSSVLYANWRLCGITVVRHHLDGMRRGAAAGSGSGPGGDRSGIWSASKLTLSAFLLVAFSPWFHGSSIYSVVCTIVVVARSVLRAAGVVVGSWRVVGRARGRPATAIYIKYYRRSHYI